MKSILLLPIALLSICCCSQKPAPETKLASDASECPTDGDCTVELLTDKTLNVRKDDLGQTYYQLLDNKGTDVIRYKYTKHKDPTLADDGYQEEIIFEIDAAKTQLQLSGSDLQSTKALFGRFCFCRGATGYYKINDGTLSATKVKEGWKIKLDFKITEVPQIINSISITAK